MRRHAFDSIRARGKPLSLKHLLRPLTRWRATARNRRVLLSLDDRLLRDIGLTRHDVAYGHGTRSDDVRAHW